MLKDPRRKKEIFTIQRTMNLVPIKSTRMRGGGDWMGTPAERSLPANGDFFSCCWVGGGGGVACVVVTVSRFSLTRSFHFFLTLSFTFTLFGSFIQSVVFDSKRLTRCLDITSQLIRRLIHSINLSTFTGIEAEWLLASKSFSQWELSNRLSDL